MTSIDVQVGEAVAAPYDPVPTLTFDTDWAKLPPPPVPVAVAFSGVGALSATAVEKLWTPLDIPGLAAWIDPQQDLAAVVYGANERMLDDSLPANTYAGDYTLGLPFTSTVAGRITHIRCYQEGGTHTYSLWDTGTQAKLASVVGVSTGPLAWQQVALPTPFNVMAGKSYTVTASTNGLNYGFTPWPGTGSLAPHLTMQWPSYYGLGSDVFPTVNNQPNHNHVDVVFQPVVSGYGDGQAISSYTSHDPSGRVFTAHASYEPNFKIVGGKPRIEFIATSGVSGDGLWSDGYNPGTAGLTYVIVMQTAAPSNYGMIMTWGEPATGMEMRYEDGSFRIQCIANYSGGGPVLSSAFASAASTDYVYLLRQDTSANKFRLYINDTLQFDGGTVPLPNTAGRMRIGWREDGYYMNGLVAEALVISGPISDSDRTKLMVYIRAKHGALPGV